MSRITIGIAFLSKPKLRAVAKIILLAEYDVEARSYVLTKTTYSQIRLQTVDVHVAERSYASGTDILTRLARVVAEKTELGYGFDTTALQIFAEEDESWAGFKLETHQPNSMHKHKKKSKKLAHVR